MGIIEMLVKNRMASFLIGIFSIGAILVSQIPLPLHQANFQDTISLPVGEIQPFCPEFTRWSQNPLTYQENSENRAGLGLIPSPLDMSLGPPKNPVIFHQSKLIFPKSQNRQMITLHKNICGEGKNGNQVLFNRIPDIRYAL